MQVPSENGLRAANYLLFERNAFRPVEHKVVAEKRICIYVNGRELATFMCSPHEMDDLAIGFLRSEELIAGYDDITALDVAPNGSCVDVWLPKAKRELPSQRIVTSGCGGGVTFDDLCKERAPLPAMGAIQACQVNPLMQALYQSASLYEEARGARTAAFSDGHRLLLVAEDIGRHNTIDRLWGQALKGGLDTRGGIIVCTGRISSEMLGKAAKMGIPIVISRTSPTSLSVQLARAWNITVIGYARGSTFRVYLAPERIEANSRSEGRQRQRQKGSD